jgi:hypothetical protein
MINRQGHLFKGALHDFANCEGCNFRPFKIKRARYAKNMLAVEVYPLADGWKSYVAVIAGNTTRRYSHRENSYIMSQAQARRFVTAWAKWHYLSPTYFFRPPLKG